MIARSHLRNVAGDVAVIVWEKSPSQKSSQAPSMPALVVATSLYENEGELILTLNRGGLAGLLPVVQFA